MKSYAWCFLILSFALSGVTHAQDIEALKQQAEKGDAAAQVKLGKMLNTGEGVTRDDAEALKWYTLSAEQGHPSAQNHLGYNYYIGAGVPKNDAEAVKWYKLAVVQDHAHSQFNLGVMYENGEGVAKNAVTAYVWYSLAAAKGFKLGQESVEKLKAKLTEAQIAEAGKLATQCKESGYKDCNL